MQTSKLVAGISFALVLACGGGVALDGPAAVEVDEPATPAPDVARPPVPAVAGAAPGASAGPHHGRAGHTGLTLQDGRVLFAGGSGSGAAVEAYSPTDGTWTELGALAQARMAHAMVRLGDGRVLIVGGQDPAQNPNDDVVGLSSAEVFDPASGASSAVASSPSAFLAPKAALLPDGQVLVVNCEVGEVRAALYDPPKDAWSEAPAPARCSGDDDLVVIDGGVLIGSGGAAFELERFEAATGAWSQTAPAPRKRTNRLAVLPDGRVFATGRLSAGDDEPDAAVLDPRTNTWTPTGKIPRAYDTIDHANFALVAAGDRVWRIGGSSGRPPVASTLVEVWDAKAGAWTAGQPLQQARSLASATALPDGSVLVVGGRAKNGGPPLTSAEILGR